MPPTHDLVLVGTGFASSFFLSRFLESAPADASVLVLERGRLDSHAWQFENQRNSSFAGQAHRSEGVAKEWAYTIAFGGGSNCWFGCTPRMLPSDFRTQTLFGVGRDWPVQYEELEPYYQEVEDVMAVAGPSGDTPFPRSAPYPQPPHLATDPERLLAAAYPGQFFRQPSARTRRATARRPRCCATGTCSLCPIDAKFTVLNELAHLYQDPRVRLELGSEVRALRTSGGRVDGLHYRQDGRELEAGAELVVLGANALFNAQILLRSQDPSPLVGRRLGEQVGRYVRVWLEGVDNFQGSTSLTGHGYMLYDGEHRRERAGCLIETSNRPVLRADYGRWRQLLDMKFIYEDLPSEANRVLLRADEPDAAIAHYEGHSAYTQRGLDALEAQLPELLSPLPVERVELSAINLTQAHIQGTTVMGEEPGTSVLDRHQLHHRWRNLLVLGSGCFPTCQAANPTLTLSALALHAADHVLGRSR